MINDDNSLSRDDSVKHIYIKTADQEYAILSVEDNTHHRSPTQGNAFYILEAYYPKFRIVPKKSCLNFAYARFSWHLLTVRNFI